MISDIDKRYMQMAIRLARQRTRDRSIEPLAGAVAVIEGRSIGRSLAGRKRGEAAALQALNETGNRAREASLFTNIEPCADSSDPESCLQHLIRLHPGRIVVGTLSGHERGAGKGRANKRNAIDRLRREGIEVDVGVCASECAELNEVYYKFQRTGLPFVTVKVASTLDGRIATAAGDSQWISGERSRKLAHELRRDHDAVLVGIGTVLKDDPQLTVRLVKGQDPLKIVVDSKLRIPSTVKLLANGGARQTIIATTAQADASRADALRKLGAEVLVLPSAVGPYESTADSESRVAVDLMELLAELGRRRIAAVLVEGGAGVITSLLAGRQVDRMVIAIAPKIIGKGIEAIGDLRIDRLKDALTFSSLKTRKLGEDIIFDARINHRPVG